MYLVGKYVLMTQGVQPPKALYLGWSAVLIGVVVHMAVSTAKQIQAKPAMPVVLPVSKLMIMVNAKLGFIVLRVFLALIGFFTLAFASGIPDAAHQNPFLLNAFLVGYSLDSVIELFGTSMEQRAAGQLAGLKKQLGIG